MTAREAGAVDRIEQIRRAHAHAKPNPVNPAWQNSHADLGFALQHIDTLRAQLEAAEAEWREKFEARTIDWSEASNALYVWRHRAKDAEARAEAAEADAARYRWLREGKGSMKWEVVDCRDPAFPISRRKEPLDAAIDAARTKEAAP